MTSIYFLDLPLLDLGHTVSTNRVMTADLVPDRRNTNGLRKCPRWQQPLTWLSN